MAVFPKLKVFVVDMGYDMKGRLVVQSLEDKTARFGSQRRASINHVSRIQGLEPQAAMDRPTAVPVRTLVAI